MYLMYSPRQLFFFQCGPEMPKGWTPLRVQCEAVACPGESELGLSYRLISIVYDGKSEETKNFTGSPISTLLLTLTPHASLMSPYSLKMIMSCIHHVGFQGSKGVDSRRECRDLIQ